jgi:hypothetical protein
MTNPIDGGPIDKEVYELLSDGTMLPAGTKADPRWTARQLRATAREFLDSTAYGRRRILLAAESWGDREALEQVIVALHREEHGICACDRGSIPPVYKDPYEKGDGGDAHDPTLHTPPPHYDEGGEG